MNFMGFHLFDLPNLQEVAHPYLQSSLKKIFNNIENTIFVTIAIVSYIITTEIVYLVPHEVHALVTFIMTTCRTKNPQLYIFLGLLVF